MKINKKSLRLPLVRLPLVRLDFDLESDALGSERYKAPDRCSDEEIAHCVKHLRKSDSLEDRRNARRLEKYARARPAFASTSRPWLPAADRRFGLKSLKP